MADIYKADGTRIDIGGGSRLPNDNSPIIEYENKIFTDAGALYDAAGFGVTALIPFSKIANGNSIVCYIANSGTPKSGRKFITYDNGTIVEKFSAAENSAVTKTITEPCNGIRFVLSLADVDDSYAYVVETGQILFAGKDTAYYGKFNAADAKQFSTLSSGYITQLKSAYSAMLADTDGNYNRIPIVAYTDQHSNFAHVCAVMSAIGYYGDWNKFSKVLQLGDCTDNVGLEKANKIIPFDKQINVIGNHDMENLVPLADHTPIMKYFPCGGNARQFNCNEWWAITDELRNVKYIVINDFEMPEGEAIHYWYISKAQIEWLIHELEKADGYDVVLLSHIPFYGGGTAYYRDNTSFTHSGAFTNDAEQNASFLSLIAARKNKQSGTYTDKDGNTVPYDFTDCDSELLMAFHGHSHDESYENLSDSITDYTFECFYANVGANKTIYFGYIDRSAKKFKNWKLYDGITAPDVQEIDIS